MSVINLGSPAIPVTVTDTGTCVAWLNDIWQAARVYAEQNGYNVIETYGVMGVAPFQKHAVSAWLGYLKVPFDEPVEVYQSWGEHEFVWLAEWLVQ